MNSYLDETSQPEFFQNEDNIIEAAAKALKYGYLRIVVGAGVSAGCGLPDWKKLVDRIAASAGVELNDMSLEDSSSYLRSNCFNDDPKAFAEAVSDALYQDYDKSLQHLSELPILRAIGALAIAGQRGGITEILTYNFDDLIEQYLKYNGFVVNSTSKLPRLNRRVDVEVFHIHGVLPSVRSEQPSQIVFTSEEFDQVIFKTSSSEDDWSLKMTDILRSSFALFIGLSGNDMNFRKLLAASSINHPLCKTGGIRGIRFASNENDPRKKTFENEHIKQVTIEHDKVPEWLLRICQKAAEMSL